jgi:hypothetical protein
LLAIVGEQIKHARACFQPVQRLVQRRCDGFRRGTHLAERRGRLSKPVRLSGDTLGGEPVCAFLGHTPGCRAGNDGHSRPADGEKDEGDPFRSSEIEEPVRTEQVEIAGNDRQQNRHEGRSHAAQPGRNGYRGGERHQREAAGPLVEQQFGPKGEHECRQRHEHGAGRVAQEPCGRGHIVPWGGSRGLRGD